MQPIYGEPRLATVLTIRDVAEMNIQVDDRLINECDSCFTVLIGLKVDENELYLGSAEEVSGVTLCHIFIKVKKINIEFVDIEPQK